MVVSVRVNFARVSEPNFVAWALLCLAKQQAHSVSTKLAYHLYTWGLAYAIRCYVAQVIAPHLQ